MSWSVSNLAFALIEDSKFNVGFHKFLAEYMMELKFRGGINEEERENKLGLAKCLMDELDEQTRGADKKILSLGAIS